MLQIRCKGRGEAPEPSAVNDFCWELSTFAQHQQAQKLAALQENEPVPAKLHVLVHCTHGFNRTGMLLCIRHIIVLINKMLTEKRLSRN